MLFPRNPAFALALLALMPLTATTGPLPLARPAQAADSEPQPKFKGSRRTNFSGSAQNWALTQELTKDVPLIKSWHAPALPGVPSKLIVADADASTGKSVILTPGAGDQLKWDITLDKPGYYAIYVRARSTPEASAWKDRLYLTCTIGSQKILLRVNFLDQHEDIAHFNFFSEAGTFPVTLSMPDKADAPLFIDQVQLRSILGNCAGGAPKTKSVLYTPAQIADIRKNTKHKPSPALSSADRAKRDQMLWSLQTSPYLPLRMPAAYEGMVPDVNPKTGTKAQWEIVDARLQSHARGFGAYTGQEPAPSARFYVKDAKTGDIFPSNDYASGDVTSGDFADDGWGWDALKHSKNAAVASQTYGTNVGMYFFVANHASQSWALLADTLNDSAENYLQTGDPHAARDATILLAEIANVYPIFDFNCLAQKNIAPTDHKFTPYDGTRGGWVYSSWQAAALAKLARSYDLVYAHIQNDLSPETLAFIQSKIPRIKTKEDLKALIETNLLQYGADQAIRRHLRGANGTWEFCLASLIAVQQDPTVTRPWVNELWTRSWMSNINEGSLPDMLVNQGMREGCTNIGQVNYAAGWQSFAIVADMLAAYVRAGADPKYDLSNPLLYPKLLPACTFPLEVRGAAGFQTNIGEGYTTPQDTIRPFPERTGIPEQRAAYRMAFEKLADPRAAAMLAVMGRYDESDDQWNAIQAAAKPFNGNPFLFNSTRALSGMGLVYLEAASQDPKPENKRAAVLRTGIAFGHGHADTLDFEFYAKGIRLVPDLGLRYVKPDTRKSRAHNVIEVDSADFVNGPSNAGGTGWATHLHDAGWVRFTRATATAATLPQVKQAARSLALIDVSPEDSYVVSLQEVQGGKKHTWCFHGPTSSEFTLGGFTEPGTGTWGNYLVDHKAPSTGTAPADLHLTFKARQGSDVYLKSTLFNVKDLPLATGQSTSYAGIHFTYVTQAAPAGESNFSTRWLQLLEPYKGKPFITSVRELSLGSVSALEVVTTQGHRDLILLDSAPDSGVGQPRKIADVEFSGRFAIVRFDNATGKVTRLYLVDGIHLKAGDQTITAPAARQSAVITSVDLLHNTFTLEKPFTGENAAGGTILLGTPARTVPFEVAKISPDGKTVTVTQTPRLFQSRVVNASGDTIKFKEPLAMLRADPNYYNGAVLFNEPGTRHWTITKTIDAQTVQVLGSATMQDFPDSDADGAPYAAIQELGPGGQATLSNAISGTVGSDGKLTITRDLGPKR